MSKKLLTSILAAISLVASCHKTEPLTANVSLEGTTKKVEYAVGENVRFANESASSLSKSIFPQTKSPEVLELKKNSYASDIKEPAAHEHVVLQYEENLTLEERIELGKKGISVLSPLTSHAYIAYLDTPASFDLPEKKMKKLVHLRPEDKLSDGILAGEYTWAMNEKNAFLTVTFFPDVSPGEAANVLESYGGDVLESLDFGSMKIESVAIPKDALRIFVDSLAREDAVQFIEPLPIPLTHTNYISRDAMNVDALQEEMPWLTGEGIVLGIYDAGLPVTAIPELYGRIVSIVSAFAPSNHATHVSCTAMGTGISSLEFLTTYCGESSSEDDVCSYVTGKEGKIDPEIATNLFRGIATSAEGVSSFQNTCDPYCFYNTPGSMVGTYSAMILEHGVSSITNSIGSNVSANGYDCSINGNADLTSRIVDMFVHGAASGIIPPVSIMYAAGNERGSARCTGKSEGYGTLGIPAAGSKNAIIVGASELHEGGLVPSFYTSFGPSDDGRLGLTVMAFGGGWEHPVISCIPMYSYNWYFITLYGGMMGTSMAAPAVEGVVTLLYQYAAAENFVMVPSLAKVVLVNTAFDLGEPVPNYKVGFGHVDAYKAVKTLEARLFARGELSDGEMETYYLLVGKDRAKVSMAYTDVPGIPNAAKVLVNDLDLEMVSPSGKVYLPLMQALTTRDSYLTLKRDDVNNVEQVLINADVSRDTEIWKVNVKGYSVVEGPQEYAVAFDVPVYKTEKAVIHSTAAFDAELDVDVYKKKCDAPEINCTYDYVSTAFSSNETITEAFDLASAFPGFTATEPGYYRFLVSLKDESGMVLKDVDGTSLVKAIDFYVH